MVDEVGQVYHRLVAFVYGGREEWVGVGRVGAGVDGVDCSLPAVESVRIGLPLFSPLCQKLLRSIIEARKVCLFRNGVGRILRKFPCDPHCIFFL